MAVRKDEEIKALFADHLEPGEILLHTAFGVKQPHIMMIIGLFLLGVLPGVIAAIVMTKNYFIGLTARRLIILRVKGFASPKIAEVFSFDRDKDLPAARIVTSENGLFNNIKISTDDREFIAKFHRAFSKSNRPNAAAISREIAATQSFS